MSEEIKKKYKLEEVSKHNSPDDCWLIIGNATNGGPKVYDVSKYLDDHPGGAEVMLDVGGQDADEFFEDIGHSKEARAELAKYYIGDFEMDEATAAKLKAAAQAKKDANGNSNLIIMVVLVAIIAAMVAYFQTMQKETASQA